MTADTPTSFVPKLRFPEFIDHGPWDAKPLDDLCNRLSETVGDTQLTPVSISAGKGFVPQAEKFGRDISGSQYRKYIRLRHGDFAYNRGNSKRFPQGCVYQLTEFDEAAASNAFYCFRLHDHLQRAFVLGFFENNGHGRQLIRHITSGARSNGLLNISADTFFGVTVPVPPTAAEQQKIADCLGSLDDLIVAEGGKLKALRQHKQGLMQQLFPQEGERRPRLRFAEFHDAGEWRPHKFGDFVVKSFYGTSASTSETGQYPVLRMGNMGDGGLDFSNLVYIDLDPEEFESFRLQKGDILLNRTNSRDLVGKISIFDRDLECITGSYIVSFRLDENRIDPWFCNLMLNTQMQQSRIKLLATPSVSQANINPTTFRTGLDIAIPKLAEQRRIAACLCSLDDMLAAQSRKVEGLKAHKHGLLQQLFPSPEGNE